MLRLDGWAMAGRRCGSVLFVVFLAAGCGVQDTAERKSAETATLPSRAPASAPPAAPAAEAPKPAAPAVEAPPIKAMAVASSVYNLELSPLKGRDPVVIASGERIDARFSIGPPRALNLLPQVEIDRRIEKIAAGRKTSIKIQMVCEVCLVNATQNRSIEFDPDTRQSTETVFQITADPNLKGRLGRIYFLLSMGGQELNHIEVVVFIDEPAPAAVGYALPSVRFLPLASDPGEPPDLVISVTPDSTRGTLAVTLQPELQALAAALKPLVPDTSAGTLRKFEVPLGAATEELQRAAADAYTRLRQMTNPDAGTRGRLEALYKAANQPTFQGGFPSDAVRLIPDHRDEALRVFKVAGQRLYRALFTEFLGADRQLQEALDVVEKFNPPGGRALRVSIATQYYLPWQLLYPAFADNDRFAAVNATRFWGFKYELTVRQIVAGQKNRLETGPLRPTAGNVVFAKGRKKGADDSVETLADDLAKIFYSAGTPPANRKIVNSAKDFIAALEAGTNDLMLVFLFSHATSGNYTTFTGERSATFTDAIGPRIEFGDKDWIRPDAIDDIYNRLGPGGLPIWKRQPIFVLNACETGSGGANIGNSGLFVASLSRLGANSVVVTESEVWARFASAWAVSFIGELRQGNDMPRAVRNARVYHLQQNRNPMGLLYSVYGSPGSRIVMPSGGF